MHPKSSVIPAILIAAAFFLCAAPAWAQPSFHGQGQPSRTLEVRGTAEVRSKPDTAYLGVEVVTRARNAEQAAGKNAALASKVVAALKSKLAGKGVVTTGNYSLMPEYNEPRPGRRPEIAGYRCRNSVEVETGDLALAGALIDAAIASGANRVNYLNFGLRNDTKARSEAITRASRNAQAQAHALFASLGLKAGPVVKASAVLPQRPPIMPAMASRVMMQAGRAPVPTPIEPGQVTVSATVSLVYEIE